MELYLENETDWDIISKHLTSTHSEYCTWIKMTSGDW